MFPGFGLPQETGGQFRFEQPAAAQAIFSASQKTSRVFDLVEGERLEFSVDLIEGGAKDSFAVLAFIPTTGGGGPGTLGGYGFAKSTTDVLVTKGVNKYFYNEDPATPIKNDNITLSMAMTVRGGNVSINARVLDKDAGDAVIFEETVVDTPAADVTPQWHRRSGGALHHERLLHAVFVPGLRFRRARGPVQSLL